jgi:cellulose 1,4-beta-cellobiosidase
VVTASGIAFLGAAAVTALGATSAYAATGTLTGSQAAPVANGAYVVQNNEWGSSAAESLATNGSAGFTVANSSITEATNSAPGGYPSIFQGCHWGDCTKGGLAAHPVPATTLTARPGTVTTSWSTTQPGGSAAYDVAYDIWFNQAPTTTGQPNGAELMVWLNSHGGVQPYGHPVGTTTIKGVSYQVWEGAQSWGDTISYKMLSPVTSVTNLEVGPLAADAIHRGYISSSWYLIDVEAGFELWRGGAGLATNSFAVNVNGGSPVAAPVRTPVRTPVHTPVRMPVHTPVRTPIHMPVRTPVPCPASSSDISLEAISPEPTAPAAATNATVDFKNASPAMASNVTTVIEVLNSAGTVVGSQSWTGQNIAPQQTLSETYAWSAASAAGKYTIEGLVKSSSGQVLQHAPVGTVTVN